jgi:hypothetical protein
MDSAQWPVVSQMPLAQPRYVLHVPLVQSYAKEPHAAPFGKLVTHVSVIGSQRWLAHWADVVHASPFATHGAQALVVSQ